MKSILIRFLVSLWNFFAVVGILFTLIAFFWGFLFFKHHNYTFEDIYFKIRKTAGQTVSEDHQDRNRVLNAAGEKYIALKLPSEAKTLPYCDIGVKRRIVRVGPEKKYKVPSQAARIVKNGDLVEIDASVYTGDVAVWKANDLVLRGVNGRVHLKADGKSAQDKGIWVIYGDNVTVENIAFSNAAVRDKNGAGIRGHGSGLTVRYCSFINNENGILAGRSGDEGTVQIEHCEFAYNGHGDGQSHGVYINNKIGQLIFQYNYIHHTKTGHHIKSRAKKNMIRYNRIMDEQDGTSSMAIDIPNGGYAIIVGNIIHQGRHADNHRVIKYQNIGKEDALGLYVVNNTVISDIKGIFVDNSTPVIASVINNLFEGDLSMGNGKYREQSNMKGNPGMFRDMGRYDFHLKPHADAVNAGMALDGRAMIQACPEDEYYHPLGKIRRKNDGKIDIGAFEY